MIVANTIEDFAKRALSHLHRADKLLIDARYVIRLLRVGATHPKVNSDKLLENIEKHLNRGKLKHVR